MSIAFVLAAQPVLAQVQGVRLIIPDTLESGSRVVGQVDFGPGFSHLRRDYVIDWGGDEGLRSAWRSDFAPNPFPAYFEPGRDGQTTKSEYVALGRPGRRRVVLTVRDEFGRTTADTVNVTVVERELELGLFLVAKGGVRVLPVVVGVPLDLPGWIGAPHFRAATPIRIVDRARTTGASGVSPRR